MGYRVGAILAISAVCLSAFAFAVPSASAQDHELRFCKVTVTFDSISFNADNEVGDDEYSVDVSVLGSKTTFAYTVPSTTTFPHSLAVGTVVYSDEHGLKDHEKTIPIHVTATELDPFFDDVAFGHTAVKANCPSTVGVTVSAIQPYGNAVLGVVDVDLAFTLVFDP